jgi:hypothetical protein
VAVDLVVGGFPAFGVLLVGRRSSSWVRSELEAIATTRGAVSLPGALPSE